MIKLLLLISITCLASEPQFHFKDCVKITHGFYLGCQGTVERFTDLGLLGRSNKSYSVQLEDCKGSQAYVELDEKEMKLSSGCVK
jgi:hypothetical protein